MKNKETLSKHIEDIPKLRFPGFKEKWKQFKFGDNFILSQGLQVPVNKQFYEPDINLERFIRIVDVTQSNEPQRYVYNPTGKGRVQDDDIFFVRYGAVGTIGYRYSGVIANNLFKVTPTFRASSDFLYQQFANGRFNSKLKELSASTSMSAINFTALNNLNFWRTNIIEQNKIGNFFSIIDKKIEQQENLLTFLNKYKRGMIFHIINEINNTSSYPFNELFVKYNCKNKDRYLQYTIGVNGIKQLESDRNTYDISKHKCFEPNSLILGIGINEIGISNCYGCCSPVYSTYKINTEIAVPDFIKYYIPIIFNKNKGLITRKSTRREFEFTKDIENLTILLPDVKEQIKIANLLETINLNIEKENKLLILLKQYKQGLLQQMFI